MDEESSKGLLLELLVQEFEYLVEEIKELLEVSLDGKPF